MWRALAFVVAASSGCAEPAPALRPVTRPALTAPPPTRPTFRAVVPTVSAFGADDEICAVQVGKVVCTKSRVEIPEPIRGVSLGPGFGCGLAASGNLYCWGKNEAGQLGLGHESATEPPTRVPLPRPVVDVSVQGSDTCAVTDDGALHCWTAAFRPRGPTRVETPGPVVDVDDCDSSHCGVLRGGGLFAVQIVGVDPRRGPVAIAIPGTAGFDSASFARQSRERDEDWAVCGVRDQRIACAATAGYPDVAGLWRRERFDHFDHHPRIAAFSMNQSPVCAISVERDVHCLGKGSVGRVAGLRGVRSLHVSPMHTCAQLENEQVRCFDGHDLEHFEDAYDPFGPGPPKY